MTTDLDVTVDVTVDVTGVWLRTSGDRIEVLVEVNGQWHRTHSEPRALIAAGEGEVSHIVEPAGITNSPVWT